MSMKVRCINDDRYISIVKGNVYEAERITEQFYGIVDETGEKFGFPSALFEIVEE